MGKLLYIGHRYHQKTKSNLFLCSLFSEKYEITSFSIDPQLSESLEGLANLPEKNFDVLVCWQVMPSIKDIKRFIRFERGIFFPMYDYYYSCKPLTDPIWAEYTDCLIICFSKHLYDDVQQAGFSAKYIQYFPAPAKSFDQGDVRSMFFWQRLTDINFYSIWPLLKDYPLKSLHIHQAIDPGEKFIPVPSDPNSPETAYYKDMAISYSSWYESKDDMIHDMQRSALYISPRFHEGIGMSFLEAMAHGRCVIGVDNPTMNEYIENGKNGFLYTLGARTSLNLTEEKIRSAQKQAYEFICDGYARWEKEKKYLVRWASEYSSGDFQKLTEAAQKYGWGNIEIAPPVSLKCRIKAKLKHCCPVKIWNLARKIFNAVSGRTVPWMQKQYCLFGCIPLFCIKQTEGKNRIRFEICAIPVYEKHTYYFGEKQ